MKYYSHHIGDFNNETRHLTRIERSIYRDMIDLYYDKEMPLTLDLDALCRKLVARTEEESTAVQQMLNEFFIKTEGGWYHDKCERGIEEYRKNISDKSAAGKASAQKRRVERLQKLNTSSTAVEQPLNDGASDEQLTNNHSPFPVNQLSSVPNGTGGEPPCEAQEAAKSVDRMTKDELWAVGKSLLAQQGMPAAQCGSFVGKLVKDYGADIVVEAVRGAVVERPVDAVSYLKASCKARAQPRDSLVSGRTPKAENFDKVDYGKTGRL